MSQGTLTVEPINQPQPQLRLMKLYTTDSLSTVSAAGYLNALVNAGHLILASDIFLITFSAGSALFSLSIDANGIITATVLPSFGPVDLTPPLIIGGNIQAGLSGTAGHFTSFPATASTGSLSLIAVANSGNFANFISNNTTGQATGWFLPDPGAASAQIMVSPAALVSGNIIQASGTLGLAIDSGLAVNRSLQANIINPDQAANFIVVRTGNIGATDLNAGTVAVFTPTGTQSYVLIQARCGGSGNANFSGGGGDKNIGLSMGATAYAAVPAATAQALASVPLLLGGGTTFAYAASASSAQAITAANPLNVAYTGGTTNYTAGNIVFEFVLQKTAS